MRVGKPNVFTNDKIFEIVKNELYMLKLLKYGICSIIYNVRFTTIIPVCSYAIYLQISNSFISTICLMY